LTRRHLPPVMPHPYPLLLRVLPLRLLRVRRLLRPPRPVLPLLLWGLPLQTFLLLPLLLLLQLLKQQSSWLLHLCRLESRILQRCRSQFSRLLLPTLLLIPLLSLFPLLAILRTNRPARQASL